jgi:hypothetical protein
MAANAADGAIIGHHRSSRAGAAYKGVGAQTANTNGTDLTNIAALLALPFAPPKSRKWRATPPKIIA